jgi:hypothetical protein
MMTGYYHKRSEKILIKKRSEKSLDRKGRGGGGVSGVLVDQFMGNGPRRIGQPVFLGGPRIPPHSNTSSVRPTVTCQLGQLDRYHHSRSLRFLLFSPQRLHPPRLCFPLPLLPAPPNAAASSSLVIIKRAPPLHRLPLLCRISPPPRDPMGCFLGCFGGAKERRRRRKRSPAQSPNGRARVKLTRFVSPPLFVPILGLDQVV